MMHGEDFFDRLFVRVDVDHPAENDGMKAATGGIAPFQSGDGAAQAKLDPVSVAPLT